MRQLYEVESYALDLRIGNVEHGCLPRLHGQRLRLNGLHVGVESVGRRVENVGHSDGVVGGCHPGIAHPREHCPVTAADCDGLDVGIVEISLGFD